MITLTKAEERIMRILWEIEKGFLKDIHEKFPDPKPPTNTVATIVNVLVKKEIIGFNQYGKAHQYYPLVSRDEYRKGQLGRLVENYYNNSFKQVVNFFSEKKNLDTKEVDEVIRMLEEIKKKKNG